VALGSRLGKEASLPRVPILLDYSWSNGTEKERRGYWEPNCACNLTSGLPDKIYNSKFKVRFR
jgi:hypothetical protein